MDVDDEDHGRERKRVRYLDELRNRDREGRSGSSPADHRPHRGRERHLVKFLRIMRTNVMPRMLDERSWQSILMAAEAVLDFEDRPAGEPEEPGE